MKITLILIFLSFQNFLISQESLKSLIIVSKIVQITTSAYKNNSQKLNNQDNSLIYKNYSKDNFKTPISQNTTELSRIINDNSSKKTLYNQIEKNVVSTEASIEADRKVLNQKDVKDLITQLEYGNNEPFTLEDLNGNISHKEGLISGIHPLQTEDFGSKKTIENNLEKNENPEYQLNTKKWPIINTFDINNVEDNNKIVKNSGLYNLFNINSKGIERKNYITFGYSNMLIY